MGLRAVLGSVLHEMNIKNNGVCKMGKRALGQYVHFTGIHISIHFESDVSFWVVTPCSVAIGYRRFGGPCCFCLPENHDLNRHRTLHNHQHY